MDRCGETKKLGNHVFTCNQDAGHNGPHKDYSHYAGYDDNY